MKAYIKYQDKFKSFEMLTILCNFLLLLVDKEQL